MAVPVFGHGESRLGVFVLGVGGAGCGGARDGGAERRWGLSSTHTHTHTCTGIRTHARTHARTRLQAAALTYLFFYLSPLRRKNDRVHKNTLCFAKMPIIRKRSSTNVYNPNHVYNPNKRSLK